jgi:hypothetical protein
MTPLLRTAALPKQARLKANRILEHSSPGFRVIKKKKKKKKKKKTGTACPRKLKGFGTCGGLGCAGL